jgi:hypothetical protein
MKPTGAESTHEPNLIFDPCIIFAGLEQIVSKQHQPDIHHGTRLDTLGAIIRAAGKVLGNSLRVIFRKFANMIRSPKHALRSSIYPTAP